MIIRQLFMLLSHRRPNYWELYDSCTALCCTALIATCTLRLTIFLAYQMRLLMRFHVLNSTVASIAPRSSGVPGSCAHGPLEPWRVGIDKAIQFSMVPATRTVCIRNVHNSFLDFWNEHDCSMPWPVSIEASHAFCRAFIVVWLGCSHLYLTD